MILMYLFSVLHHALTNITAKESINQRFYTTLKASIENAIAIDDSINDIYIDLHTLSDVLIKALSYNLEGFTDKFYLYVNSYYSDLTPCSYACKTVNVRLRINVNITFTYDKSYRLSLEENDYV